MIALPSPEGVDFPIRGYLSPAKDLFDFDQFFLKSEAKKALRLVAEMLKNQPGKKILIVGYTDT